MDAEDQEAAMTDRPKQKTKKGLKIDVPKRSEFDAAIEKIAPKAGRKRPAEKDRPPEQSG
jgi:hypothetical protein